MNTHCTSTTRKQWRIKYRKWRRQEQTTFRSYSANSVPHLCHIETRSLYLCGFKGFLHGFKSHMLHYLRNPLRQRVLRFSQYLCGFEALPHSITFYQILTHFVPHFKNLCHICATFKAQKAPISQSGSFFAKNRLFLQIVYKIYNLFIFCAGFHSLATNKTTLLMMRYLSVKFALFAAYSAFSAELYTFSVSFVHLPLFSINMAYSVLLISIIFSLCVRNIVDIVLHRAFDRMDY